MNRRPSRRIFLQSTAAVAVTAATCGSGFSLAAEAKPPKFRKAVKYGMIGEGKSIREKFDLIKSLGFEGVEVDAPGGLDKQEALAAAKGAGIQIHGVIDAVHWQTSLSDPDSAVREKGL